MNRLTFLKLPVLLISFLFIYVNGKCNTLYWVGGSGDWHSLQHWSFSSNGIGGATIPTATDDVIFDQNSFTAPNDNVSLSGVMECHNITWTSDVPSIIISGGETSTLNVYGSFVLNPRLTWNYAGELNFKSATNGNSINTYGIPLEGGVTFEGTGGWKLGNSLVLSPSSTLTFMSGSLNANGNTIQCDILKITGSGYKMLDYSNSTLAIKQESDDIGTTNFNYNSAESKLYIQNASELNNSINPINHLLTGNLSAHPRPGSVISFQLVINPPTCNAGDTGNSCNGSIILRNITTNDGKHYSVSWAGQGLSGVVSDSVFNLCANSYSYTLYDSADGSTYTNGAVNVTVPPQSPLSVNFIKRNETCRGVCDGSLVTNISGETPNYTYRWSTGAIGTAVGNPSSLFSISSLCVGNFALRVKDANGCVNTFKTSIGQPLAFSIGFSPITNLSCNGVCNGSATANVSGGHAGVYTYSWAPGGQTTATATGLCAGTYTLTIEDDSTCSATATVLITQPAPFSTTATDLANVTCNGGDNGDASATPSGGVTAYTYSWSNGTSTVSGSNPTGPVLSNGSYTVTVTDNSGCTATASVDITQPATSVSISIGSKTNSSGCVPNGSITANAATGGTAPYAYSWSAGGTNLTITGLSGGTYTITATDNHGCTATASASITQPIVVSTSASVIANINCNGANNGNADATPSGGATPYTYAWSNGTSTVSPSNPTGPVLSAGNYTVTVTDNAGCTATASVSITQPALLATAASITSNITCNGANNANANANPSGGATAYTYSWYNGTSTVSTSNPTGPILSNGSYTVTLTDSHGCTATSSVAITQPAVLTTSASALANVSCKGGNDGNADASPSGGTTPYTYSWSSGSTNNPTGTGLTAGGYTVTVTDNRGCTATATVSITEPIAALSTTASILANVDCHGNADGNASANPSGGTVPYTYTWSNGVITNPTGTVLTAGGYTVTVHDNHGCSATASVNITQPLTVLSISIASHTNSSGCSPSGSATANPATGGTPNYSYLWSPSGGTNLIASSLSGGTYTITATDNHGCTATASVTITQPAFALSTSASAIANVSCNGGDNGNADATPSGGTTPYTYSWSNGEGTNNPTGAILSAGTYTVTVTDNAGCTATASVNISQPIALTATTTVLANVSCNGGNDGNAGATPSNGTAPYTYLWSDGVTTNPTGAVLAAGGYTVTVHDNHGCSTTASVSISQPPTPLAITMASQTNSSECNKTGTATANSATGGTTPYTYSWSAGGTNLTITGLSSGTYIITATDNHGCTAIASATITQPLALSATAGALTSVLCNGGNNGNAIANPSGGATAYTYSWSNGTSTVSTSNPTGAGLIAGGYTVTVTDINGCNATASALITQPLVLSTSAIVLANVSCNGGNNGDAAANPTGGMVPYTYTWSNGVSTVSVSNPTGAVLSNGGYTVTVTDNNGCTATASVSITQPISALSTTSTVLANVSCNGGNNGNAKANPSGGTAPYTYSWSNGSTSTVSTSSPTGAILTAGSYTITVMDNNGCTATANATITQPLVALSITMASHTNSSECNSTGTATANAATGGTAPYTYSWSTGSTNLAISGLSGGTYIITATDNHGCNAIATVIITQPLAVNTAIAQTNVTCHGSCNGIAIANTSGGNAPYTYSWNTAQTNQTISGLCANLYTVTVTDNSGCTSTASATITQPTLLTASISSDTITCHNSCDGVSIVTASGGTAPYTYIVSDGFTIKTYYNDTITNLCPNITYTIAIEDFNTCSYSDSAFFKNPPAIVETHTVVNSTCNSVNDASVTISVSGGKTPYTYKWSPGGQTTQNLTNVLSGTDTLTIRDSNGCSIIDTIVIPSNFTIVADAGKDTSTCANFPLTLNGSGSLNAASYAWFQMPGFTQISNITTVTVSSGTTANYVLVVSNAGCTDTGSVSVTINPAVTVDAGSAQSIIPGESAGIGGNPTAPAGSSYIWEPDFGLSDTIVANPSASPSVTTTYTVNVASASGCPGSDTVTVFVVPHIVIPDGFTPNGDGQNDYWVLGYVSDFPNISVEVYNRWGELLFHSTGYNIPWDGTYNGKPLPIGTYYYIINLNDPRFPKASTGPVTILR